MRRNSTSASYGVRFCCRIFLLHWELGRRKTKLFFSLWIFQFKSTLCLLPFYSLSPETLRSLCSVMNYVHNWNQPRNSLFSLFRKKMISFFMKQISVRSRQMINFLLLTFRTGDYKRVNKLLIVNKYNYTLHEKNCTKKVQIFANYLQREGLLIFRDFSCLCL